MIHADHLTAQIDVTPEHLSTAGLVALDAACARARAERGLGSGLSDSVGRYAGVLVARALGGHVEQAHVRGADVITMFGDRVRVRTHVGRRPTHYSRASFAELFTDDVTEAIHLHLGLRDMRVMRGIKVTRGDVATDPTSPVIEGLDITKWLWDSARVLEFVRGQVLPPAEHGFEYLDLHERDRIYAIYRIYYEGSDWLDEVRRLKIYPYRQEDKQ